MLRAAGPKKIWLHNEVLFVFEATTGPGTIVETRPHNGGSQINSQSIVDRVGKQAYAHVSLSPSFSQFEISASVGSVTESTTLNYEVTSSYPYSTIRTSISQTTTNQMAVFKLSSSKGIDSTTFVHSNGGIWLDGLLLDFTTVDTTTTSNTLTKGTHYFNLVLHNLAYGKHNLRVIAVDIETKQHDLDPAVFT